MLDLPVRMSMLGVRWQREHLAVSGDDQDSELDDEDELELEAELGVESSLVTCRTFCCG